MSADDRQIILGALDTLGVALAAHQHQWTDGERTIYEHATELLGVPKLPPQAEKGDEWKD